MQKSRKILVTGGAGFVGSFLCERLLSEGHEVIALDNFFTGNKDNLKKLISNPRFSVLVYDVRNPIYVPVDQIYNLACPASPVHYQHDPVATVTVNVAGMINMLELARQTGATILQASTSEVYGDPDVHPQPETYRGSVNPTGPRACYDEGKRCAETLCFDYHRQYGVKIKVARIFNTYGPNMHPDDGRVVSNFIVQALRGDPITIYGDGRQTRSFCYVSDLVEGLTRLMNTQDDVTGPVNLGNPGEFEIRELAEKVKALVNPGLGYDFRPLPTDDPVQRQPDITLAGKLLGWKPTIALDQGLLPTIAYFSERLGLPVKAAMATSEVAR